MQRATPSPSRCLISWLRQARAPSSTCASIPTCGASMRATLIVAPRGWGCARPKGGSTSCEEASAPRDPVVHRRHGRPTSCASGARRSNYRATRQSTLCRPTTSARSPTAPTTGRATGATRTTTSARRAITRCARHTRCCVIASIARRTSRRTRGGRWAPPRRTACGIMPARRLWTTDEMRSATGSTGRWACRLGCGAARAPAPTATCTWPRTVATLAVRGRRCRR